MPKFGRSSGRAIGDVRGVRVKTYADFPSVPTFENIQLNSRANPCHQPPTTTDITTPAQIAHSELTMPIKQSTIPAFEVQEHDRLRFLFSAAVECAEPLPTDGRVASAAGHC